MFQACRLAVLKLVKVSCSKEIFIRLCNQITIIKYIKMILNNMVDLYKNKIDPFLECGLNVWE